MNSAEIGRKVTNFESVTKIRSSEILVDKHRNYLEKGQIGICFK